jgi:hypothetical protein
MLRCSYPLSEHVFSIYEGWATATRSNTSVVRFGSVLLLLLLLLLRAAGAGV